MKKIYLTIFFVLFVFCFFSSAAEAVEKSIVTNNDGEIILSIPSCKVGEDFFSVDLLLQDDLFFEIVNASEIDMWQGVFRRLDINTAAAWLEEEEKLIVYSAGLTDEKGNIIYYEMSFRFVTGSNLLQLTDWIHKNLKFYGPAFTAVDGIGDKEGYISEVSPFSNLAMIGSTYVEDDISKIKEAASCGMKSIVVIPYDIFFKITWDENGQLINVELNPDRKEEWLKYREQIQPVKKEILGFFLFDEMYWVALQCGISFKEMKQMMEDAASAIKAQFPNTKVVGSIAITEGDLEKEFLYGFPVPLNARDEYGIPENWDWIAIYNYLAQHEGEIEQFYETWSKRRESFDKYMHPHQDIILVPGTFQFNFQDSMEDKLLALADFYYDMAKTNPKIVAVMPFLWPSFEHLVGMEEMPVLQQRWSEIGQKIINNN